MALDEDTRIAIGVEVRNAFADAMGRIVLPRIARLEKALSLPPPKDPDDGPPSEGDVVPLESFSARVTGHDLALEAVQADVAAIKKSMGIGVTVRQWLRSREMRKLVTTMTVLLGLAGTAWQARLAAEAARSSAAVHAAPAPAPLPAGAAPK